MAGVPQPTKNITSKVVAATGGSAVGSAVATLVIFLINKVAPNFLDATASAAIVTIVSALVALLAGYIKAPGENETAVVVDGQPKTALV